MTPPLPSALGRSPLIEALWELRFAGSGVPVADWLPGMLYAPLGGRFQQVTRLPLAAWPAEVRARDPHLRYAPTLRLDGEGRTLLIGEQMVALSCPRPYPGWTCLGTEIRTLAAALRETGRVVGLERCSLKTVNLIPTPAPASLAALEVDLALLGAPVGGRPVQLRTELATGAVTQILNLVAPAELTLGPEATPGPGSAPNPASNPSQGVLVDIDSILPLPAESTWEALEAGLDGLHLAPRR